MFNEIIFYTVFGIPMIVIGGGVTLLCLLITAAIPALNRKGIKFLPISWHMKFAAITILLALVHGFLGMLAFL